MSEGFAEHIVYVDESGDHGRASPEYPVFVLAFCLFDKEVYASEFTTAVQRLKFKYFGHDTIVLHEREIRKALPPFECLRGQGPREAFMNDLNALVESAPFKLVAAVIRKTKLEAQYASPDNPYHLAMQFGLERIARELRLTAASRPVHVVVEKRGRREDDELELAFRRVCDGDNFPREKWPMRIVFAAKEGNYAGMELADLVARPIGRHILAPTAPNRAWEIIKLKLRRSPEGEILGWGIKSFP